MDTVITRERQSLSHSENSLFAGTVREAAEYASLACRLSTLVRESHSWLHSEHCPSASIPSFINSFIEWRALRGTHFLLGTLSRRDGARLVGRQEERRKEQGMATRRRASPCAASKRLLLAVCLRAALQSPLLGCFSHCPAPWLIAPSPLRIPLHPSAAARARSIAAALADNTRILSLPLSHSLLGAHPR